MKLPIATYSTQILSSLGTRFEEISRSRQNSSIYFGGFLCANGSFVLHGEEMHLYSLCAITNACVADLVLEITALNINILLPILPAAIVSVM